MTAGNAALYDAYERVVEIYDARYIEVLNNMGNIVKLKRYEAALRSRNLAALMYNTSCVTKDKAMCKCP